MKKKLTLVTSAALLLSLGFTMAGCGKGVAKISPEYEGEYSISVNQNVIQANAATGYSYNFGADDDAGHVIVEEKVPNTNPAILATTISTYKVFDLTSNQWTNISSSNELSVLDEGVFYSVTTIDAMGTALPAPLYTLYSTAGYSTPNAVKGSISGSVFYAEDGSRWYVNVDGELVQETDPFAMILVNASTHKIGKYYVTGSEGAFNVFDKKGNYEHSFNYQYTLGLTEDMKVEYSWMAGYNMFFQITTELPEYEDEYDLITEDGKYDVATYSYNIKNNKVKEIKKFNYIVEGNVTEGGAEDDVLDYAVLRVKEIQNKRMSNTTLVQSFGDNGKVYYDIQKLVPGAVSIEFTEAGYTLLKDYAGFTYIYEKDDCVLTIPANTTSVNFASGDIVYYMNGDTLNIYDLDSNSIVSSVQKVKSVNVNNYGNIVFSTYDEISMTTTYHFFNVDTLSESNARTLAATEAKVGGSFSGSYVCISYADMTTASTKYYISFPDSNLADMTGFDGVEAVGTYDIDNVTYTIFKTTAKTVGSYDPTTGQPIAAGEIVSYHVGVEVFPTVK